MPEVGPSRILGVIVLGLALSACESMSGHNSLKGDMSPRDWIDPDTLLERESLYCYKTLGDYDCYQSPQRNQGGRLEGYYGPPPS